MGSAARFLLATVSLGTLASSAVFGANLAFTQDLPLDPGIQLEVELRAGNIVVDRGSEAGVLRASVTWTCADSDSSRCTEAAGKLGLNTSATGQRLTVGVAGMPTLNLVRLTPTLHVVVPAGHRVEVDLGAGNVRVGDLTDGLEIDLGAGNVEGSFPLAAVGRVELDSRAGRATLKLPDSSIVGSGLVGSSVTWSREEGGGQIEIDLGAGDIVVTLVAADAPPAL